MGQLNTYNTIYSDGNERYVTDRTSSMLDTPQQDKLYKHLYMLNPCEQSCIMMIRGGSKMSKTEYDLEAIIYPA